MRGTVAAHGGENEGLEREKTHKGKDRGGGGQDRTFATT